MNANIMIFDILDQFALTKLSSKSRTNCQRLYKVSADVNRQLAVLSAHVLSAFNAHISETDMKKLSDAD